MKLLVDMGNSRMKWATVSKGDLSQVNSLVYPESGSELQGQWQKLATPQQIWVSCVASDEHWAWVTELIQTLWNLQAERINSLAQQLGVTNGYTDVAKLGSDRWAALVAAHQLYPATACIVDSGTALTLDGVTAEGKHLGGIILPGVQMMQSSLAQNTAAIKATANPDTMQNSLPDVWLSQDTNTGIVAGSWLASIAIVEKISSALTEQYGDKVVCIVTGGNARQLAHGLSIDYIVDTELVLKGLAFIAGEKLTR